MNTKQLKKKIFINITMKLITGLHIGDNKENVEIGGVDNPVIRRKDNNEPFIPGSSLKGKIRCLLEQSKGENANSRCQNTNTIVCKLFGASENGEEIKRLRKKLEDKIITKHQFEMDIIKFENIPSKIIVRDSYLTSNWSDKLRESEYTDMPYTEIKWENVINRIKGTAEHPRQQERIPAGAEFDVNFIINIFDEDVTKENNLLKTLFDGLELLENDYLGGSGSRGYGQVKFISPDKIIEKVYVVSDDELSVTTNEININEEFKEKVSSDFIKILPESNA